ncbi:hypothetical protein [Actinopolymorpha rutila]|uniref:Methyltransferase domain-containing protein n=1 Tax=Actinopolymorpha rutila TaxID=446787 RepID=A0A852ZN99_9ACTN|nr:hypothetical protein [Actinopolymorpha rutila]NYH93595.1 hypothetical protein [Actinopolymorpha rutila]
MPWTDDVYQMPPDLLTGRFDVVFTGCGALCWLPDISRWATIVVSCLKLGGRLLLEEMHPLRAAWTSKVIGSWPRMRTTSSAGRRGCGRRVRSAGPARLAGAADTHMPEKVEFRWPIGDVVTALARAGMRTELLDEYFSPPESADLPSAIVEQLGRFPNDSTLLARKDADPAESSR